MAKTVRLASDFTYPPFNYMDASGNPAGFDIEIADALCQAKLECTWVSQSWDSLIPALMAHKSDVIMASMRITEERKNAYCLPTSITKRQHALWRTANKTGYQQRRPER